MRMPPRARRHFPTAKHRLCVAAPIPQATTALDPFPPLAHLHGRPSSNAPLFFPRVHPAPIVRLPNPNLATRWSATTRLKISRRKPTAPTSAFTTASGRHTLSFPMGDGHCARARARVRARVCVCVRALGALVRARVRVCVCVCALGVLVQVRVCIAKQLDAVGLFPWPSL